MSVSGLAHSEQRGDSPAAFRRVYIAAGLLGVLVTIVMVMKYLDGDYKDAGTWYDAARHALTGGELVGLPNYRYPPTFAVLIAPLCILPFWFFFFSWYAINVGLFAVSSWLTTRLAVPPGEKVTPLLVWLPALLVAVFAIDNLFLDQANILITVLMYWGMLEVMRNREWRAGIPLGAAIALKAFPAPLILYFLYRRAYKVSLAMVLSTLFFLLIFPAPLRGLQRNFSEVGLWAERVVFPYVSKGEPGDWGAHGLDYDNQSLSVALHRLLSPVDAYPVARHLPTHLYVNVLNLSESQINHIVAGIFAALCLAFIAACGWKKPKDRMQQATEFSLVITLLLLASAISWTYFFVALMLPVAVALRLLGEPGRPRQSSVWALRIALVLLGLATVLMMSDYARAAGNLCWADVAMFVALALACRDLKSVPADIASPSV